MIRIAICDDDKILLEHAKNILKSNIDCFKNDIFIQTFEDGNKMLSDATKEISVFDIIFLDIDMPSISGFEVAEILRRNNENIIIIFLTSMEHLVFESFKYKPFRFIRKNKLEEELNEVLHSAISEIEKNTVYQFNFKTEEGEMKIGSSDILYIECLNRKVYLKVENKKIYIPGIKFSEILNEFDDKEFILVHRTCLVNLRYIYSIGKLDITLDNGEKLPLSRYKVSEVKRAFTLYVE